MKAFFPVATVIPVFLTLSFRLAVVSSHRLLDLVTLPFHRATMKIGYIQRSIVRSPSQTLILPDGTQGVCVEILLQEL